MEEFETLWAPGSNKIMEKPLERCVRRLAHREKEIEVLSHCICSWCGGQALQQEYFKEEEDAVFTDKPLLNPLCPA